MSGPPALICSSKGLQTVQHADKLGLDALISHFFPLVNGRIIAAIVENYQNKDGSISVPDALQPFIHKKKI